MPPKVDLFITRSIEPTPGSPFLRTRAISLRFERILAEAVTRYGMRLLPCCLMPNHFDFSLWPRGDGELSQFIQWLTLTVTQRRHAHHHSAGSGLLYPGSFQILPRAMRRPSYCLPLRGAKRAASWVGGAGRGLAIGSFARCHTIDAGTEPRSIRWPIDKPPDWTLRVSTPMTPAEEEAVHRSIRRGQPYGSAHWQKRTAVRLGLESTFRPRGSPVKTPNNGT